MNLSYKRKIIVAPMVRVSTLPFRLLCLDYGADLVYSEETIDFKMLRSIQRENEFLGTTDFIDQTDGTIFFRTCEREKKHLVFQIGTSDAQRALKVSKMVEPYVSAVDINMGCPKEFSIKGGMGAALLKQPEKIEKILKTLVSNLSIQVTCKIRILPTVEETISLCKRIEACGVAAIGIHGRTKEERPNDPNHNDVIKTIAASLTIPVIANGGSKEISSLACAEEFRLRCGAASVMLARCVMWNCSMLRTEGKLSLDEVIPAFLRYCIQYENPFTLTKYAVQNMLRELQNNNKGKAFLEAQTLREICTFWDLKENFNDHLTKSLRFNPTPFQVNHKSCTPHSLEDIEIHKRITDEGETITELPVQFIRGNYSDARLPKMLLNTYSYRQGLERPKFEVICKEKFFIGQVDVGGEKYATLVREKNRRYAEQAAALACLHVLGTVDKTYGFVPLLGTRKYDFFETSEEVMAKAPKKRRHRKTKMEDAKKDDVASLESNGTVEKEIEDDLSEEKEMEKDLNCNVEDQNISKLNLGSENR